KREPAAVRPYPGEETRLRPDAAPTTQMKYEVTQFRQKDEGTKKKLSHFNMRRPFLVFPDIGVAVAGGGLSGLFWRTGWIWARKHGFQDAFFLMFCARKVNYQVLKSPKLVSCMYAIPICPCAISIGLRAIRNCTRVNPVCTYAIPIGTRAIPNRTRVNPVCTHAIPIYTCVNPVCTYAIPICTRATPNCTRVNSVCTYAIPICTRANRNCTRVNSVCTYAIPIYTCVNPIYTRVAVFEKRENRRF